MKHNSILFKSFTICLDLQLRKLVKSFTLNDFVGFCAQVPPVVLPGNHIFLQLFFSGLDLGHAPFVSMTE